MRLARRRVLRALACIAASLSSRGGAALGSAGSAASSPVPGSAASSPAARPVRPPAADIPEKKVAAPAPGPPAAATPARSALVGARGFLLAGRDEPTGFGAYGYLLLLEPPRDDERARHLSVLAAWLREYPTVDDFLQNRVQPREISLIQLPVRYEPQLPLRPQSESDAALLAAAKKLLEAYDYARAQAVAARLSLRIAGSGPALVTLVRPAGEGISAVALVEDMSGVAPGVAEAWLREAMHVALQPRTWSTADALVRLALRMRNVVAQLAATLPDPRLRADERVQLVQMAAR
jgi:hypothetical protein